MYWATDGTSIRTPDRESNWPDSATLIAYLRRLWITSSRRGGEMVNALAWYPLSPNHKWTTAYFRHRLDPADPAGITGGNLRLKRDDGAIVYINGREAVRNNIPAGPVNASTF